MGSQLRLVPSNDEFMDGMDLLAKNKTIVVTGAAGFIGCRVVASLLGMGFTNLRCLVRPSSDTRMLHEVRAGHASQSVSVMSGNLLSKDFCRLAAQNASVVIHLVTGRGKSFAGCFQNSVVTTRNVLDAIAGSSEFVRFVNVSSFAVYSNLGLRKGAFLDESCPVEDNLEERYDAYVYAKLKQDLLVESYHAQHGIPFVTVRPGVVIGPGKKAIPGAVGLDTFGFFLHLGGGNRLPLTYVDNCADAIAMAGVVGGVDGEVFNVIDDDLPSSRAFLRRYKKEVGRFRTVSVPYPLFYLFCRAWESYAKSSGGQLPPVFNRRFCAFNWRGQSFSNQKLKAKLGWKPKVSMSEALDRYFAYQRTHG